MTYNYNYDMGRREVEIIVKALQAFSDDKAMQDSDVRDALCLRNYLLSLCETDQNGVILGFKKEN